MNRFITLGLCVAFVAGLWSAAWFFAAREISNGLAPGDGPDEATQTQLACADLSVAGFPFWFDVRCGSAELRIADARYVIEGVRLRTPSYWPMRALVEIAGPLRISDSFYGSESEVRWSKLEGTARLSLLHIARISIHAEGVDYLDSLLGETLIAHADSAEIHLADSGAFDADSDVMGLNGFADLKGFDLPASGIDDGTGQLDVTLSNVPANVTSWGNDDLLRRWRDANGALIINRVEGADRSARFSATGQFQLDDEGRPEGELIAQSNGVVERLGPLIPEGVEPLLGSRSDDGTLNQAYTISAGMLFAGLVPIAPVPPLIAAE